jgi:hypothetical protein
MVASLVAGRLLPLRHLQTVTLDTPRALATSLVLTATAGNDGLAIQQSLSDS